MILRIDLEDAFPANTNLPHINYIILSDITNIYTPNISNHNIAELHYVRNGNGFLQADNNIYELKEKDFFVINPDVMHGEYVKKGETLVYYIIGVSNANFSSQDSRSLFEPISLPDKAPIVQTIERMFEEAKGKQADRDKAIQSLSDLLMVDTQRLYKLHINPVEYHSPNAQINRIQAYLDENYKENLTVDSIAEKFMINPSTLAQNFRKYVGVSIIKYINNKKLDDAQMLLTISDLPISQISGMLGFCSPVYFSHYFKKHLNLTPSEFRSERQGSKH